MGVQVFLPLGGLVNTSRRCTLHTRGEAGGQNRQGKLFKHFWSCLKILILFHCFLRFACHGNHVLSPPHPPHPPPGEELMLHPVQERGAAGGALPCPSPTALLAWGPSGPADTRMLGSEALRLGTGD